MFGRWPGSDRGRSDRCLQADQGDAADRPRYRRPHRRSGDVSPIRSGGTRSSGWASRRATACCRGCWASSARSTTAAMTCGGVAILCSAAEFLVEGVGLLKKRRWAEWLTVGVTASFIPSGLRSRATFQRQQDRRTDHQPHSDLSGVGSRLAGRTVDHRLGPPARLHRRRHAVRG